jgi:hypothetical protein
MAYRVLLLAAMFLLALAPAAAQNTVLSNFDHDVRDNVWDSQVWDNWVWGTECTTMWDTATGQFEGEGALKIDWFNYQTGWDWYGTIWYRFLTYTAGSGTFLDLSTRDTIKIRYKVVSGAPDSSARNFHFYVILYDGADLPYGGGNEQWVSKTDVRLDVPTAEWQTISIPLVDLGETSVDSSIGRGFAYGKDGTNKQLDFDRISGFQFDVSAKGSEVPTDAGGTILLDLWEATGNVTRTIDRTPPGPTQGIAVAATPLVNFSNTVSWTMTSEPFGLYNVYYDLKPITDVDEPQIDLLRGGADVATTELDHALVAPNVDQEVTYYYTVATIDRARNLGELPASVSRTAMAKGIPSIALGAPQNFFADGDLSDWENVKPTLVNKELGSFAGGTVDDSLDLSGKVYLAVDDTYLYAAFDVVDNYTYFGNTDRYDSPELFLGLYNGHGSPHSAFQRGDEPDHYMRFETDSALIGWYDSWYVTSPLVLYPGDDYLFTPKAAPATGYIVEARIRWDSLSARSGDALFVPKEGMRLPFGVGINDCDVTPGDREGALYHGDENNWSGPSSWEFTWIGNTMTVVSVPGEQGIPLVYGLSQNYPNPFNPATQIAYTIPASQHVKLQVYDVLGRLVTTLVDANQEIGRHVVEFDASRLSSGVYVYRLEAGGFCAAKKLMLLK